MDPSPRQRHGRPLRIALSLFFFLHLGSIGVYHLPEGPPDIPGAPSAVAEVAGALLPPVKRAAWPAVRRYMDATATRQHWTLFAPWPASWTVSLNAVGFYPALDPGSTEGAAPPGDSLRWVADTVRIEGPEEAPYPHWTDHRSHRIVYNMGYEKWGRYYRPIFARWLCRTLPGGGSEGEARPDGVALTAYWREMVAPWEEREPASYEQSLGGYTCAEP